MADPKVLVAKRFNGGKPGGEAALDALGIVDTEVRILADFFSAARWEPDPSGIVVQKGHIVHLDIRPAGHASSAPPLLGPLRALSRLRSLNVYSYIGRSAEVEEGFFDMPRLEKLEINYLMKGIIPKEIAGLTNLTELAVTSCKIKALDPELRFPPSLLKLDLGHNALTAIPAAVFEVAALEELLLDANKLANADGPWQKLSSLKKLSLVSNKLKALSEDLVKPGAAPKLEWMDIGYNPIKKLPATLGNLRSLKTLEASDTGLTHGALSGVPKGVEVFGVVGE